MPGCLSERLLQSKSPDGGSRQLGEDGRARQPKVGADRTERCGGKAVCGSLVSFWVPLWSSAWSRQGVWCADVWGLLRDRPRSLEWDLACSWRPILYCPATPWGTCPTGHTNRVLSMGGLSIKDRRSLHVCQDGVVRVSDVSMQGCGNI